VGYVIYSMEIDIHEVVLSCLGRIAAKSANLKFLHSDPNHKALVRYTA
jgi:hypothetical protein